MHPIDNESSEGFELNGGEEMRRQLWTSEDLVQQLEIRQLMIDCWRRKEQHGQQHGQDELDSLAMTLSNACWSSLLESHVRGTHACETHAPPPPCLIH
jgi:hypothetical protein